MCFNQLISRFFFYRFLQFILDSQPLSKHEKSLVGYYQNFNNWPGKRRGPKLKRSSGFSTPARRTTDTTPASSIGSFRSFQFEGSTSSTADLTTENEMTASQLSTSTQKRIKVRPALIADDDNDDGVEIVTTTPSKKHSLKLESPKLERMGSREHLKTKQQIEDLRKEYGDGWLQCKSASKVQDVMGIQAPIKSLSLKTTEEKLESMFNLGSSSTISGEHHTSTPIQKSKYRDFGHSPAEVRFPID